MINKPIIGLAGGIGSGKSRVARRLGELGGFVFDADAVAQQALDTPEVQAQLVAWYGRGVLDAHERVDRKALADKVFESPGERQRLEGLIHPEVARQRDRLVKQAMQDPGVRFIVYDVPLLYEVGMDQSCDHVLFVQADRAVRLARVAATRGWDEQELLRRENNQMDPERKMRLADAIINNNNGDETSMSSQVQAFVSQILLTS